MHKSISFGTSSCHRKFIYMLEILCSSSNVFISCRRFYCMKTLHHNAVSVPINNLGNDKGLNSIIKSVCSDYTSYVSDNGKFSSLVIPQKVSKLIDHRPLIIMRRGTPSPPSMWLCGTSFDRGARNMGECQKRFQASKPMSFSEISEALSIIGVSINFDEKELKSKYRTLVKAHHPDAGGTEEGMSKISVAYQKLSELSKKDKEYYERQKNSYNPNNNKQWPGVHRSRTNGFKTSPFEGSGTYDTQWEQKTEYAKAYAHARQQQQAHRARYGSGNPFSQNPFANSNTSFSSFARNISGMPFPGILMRGFVAYLVISFCVAVIYRKYRERDHDDGWRMAESLSRHEQLQELNNIRRELRNRVDGNNEANGSPSTASSLFNGRGLGFAGPLMHRDQYMQDMERLKEVKALESANRRQLELKMQELEMKGWPKVDPSKGYLWKNPMDPVGVVYFEPVAHQYASVVESQRLKEAMREQMIQEPQFITSQSVLAARRASNNALNSRPATDVYNTSGTADIPHHTGSNYHESSYPPPKAV
eukprot:Tbor_TRINITY_DN3865_c0_g2::TRINITY_DN3865_c0_g2_i1::g.5634::m.5634